MNTGTHSTIQATLESTVNQLLERAAAPSKTGGSHVLRWLLLIGAVFLAWKAFRGMKSLFWTAFGLGMAVFWTGIWRVWL